MRTGTESSCRAWLIISFCWPAPGPSPFAETETEFNAHRVLTVNTGQTQTRLPEEALKAAYKAKKRVKNYAILVHAESTSALLVVGMKPPPKPTVIGAEVSASPIAEATSSTDAASVTEAASASTANTESATTLASVAENTIANNMVVKGGWRGAPYCYAGSGCREKHVFCDPAKGLRSYGQSQAKS